MPGRIYTFRDIDRDIDERCDVVVIGSGAGGGVCATELAEAGFDVVLLEEGGYYKTEEFSTDSLEGGKRLFRHGGMGMALGRPPVLFSEGRCVGGTTVINGGMCWRTPDKVLRRWEWEQGLQGFSPKEMEPFFERVEARASMRHQDPESVGKDAHLFEAACRRLGWKVTHNKRDQLHCVGTNNCALGCTSGAKQSTLVSYIPRGINYGVRLYSNCHVKKLIIENGRAVGVEGYFTDFDFMRGHKMKVRADIVIVAGGASQTPALLFRSGLFKANKNIGKNLMFHPNAKTVGIYDQELKAWQGVHQNFQVHEFIDEGLLLATGMMPPNILATALVGTGHATAEVMQQFNYMMPIGVLVEDTTVGRIFPLPGGGSLITYNINDHDFHVALRGVALCAKAHFEMGARRVLLPFSRLHELRSVDEIPKIFSHKPKLSEIELFSAHIMGTCRISATKEDGVIDKNGQSHDIKNLFIADASVFPSPIGLNPMETIMALATKTCAHIVENKSRYIQKSARSQAPSQ
jgi:choline dehydrogenase-like flavoprotein